VVERLQEFGITEIHTGIAQSGLVALIHGRAPWPGDRPARRYGCAAN
jgi:hippurate hydrolase